MRPYLSKDAVVKDRLRQWPQHPPGHQPSPGDGGTWLRARPSPDDGHFPPYLKLPGSTHLRTLPDGLWLNFRGTPVEPFVDIFAVEACGTMQNLLDKRSRFAASTHSLLAVCPLPWLLAAVSPGDATPRWRATGVLLAEPTVAVMLPVRDLRVMYGLKRLHYTGFARHQVPHAHEYFVPIETLMAEHSEQDPALQALLARASFAANFLSPP